MRSSSPSAPNPTSKCAGRAAGSFAVARSPRSGRRTAEGLLDPPPLDRVQARVGLGVDRSARPASRVLDHHLGDVRAGRPPRCCSCVSSSSSSCVDPVAAAGEVLVEVVAVVDGLRPRTYLMKNWNGQSRYDFELAGLKACSGPNRAARPRDRGRVREPAVVGRRTARRRGGRAVSVRADGRPVEDPAVPRVGASRRELAASSPHAGEGHGADPGVGRGDGQVGVVEQGRVEPVVIVSRRPRRAPGSSPGPGRRGTRRAGLPAPSRRGVG